MNSIAKAAAQKVGSFRGQDQQQLNSLAEATSNLYNEDDYLLAPWRFAASGWRYVKKSEPNQFLNHPNKDKNNASYGSIQQKINESKNANYSSD